jgi:RHS repeat-associated protein
MEIDYELVGFRIAIGTLGHKRLDHRWAHDVYPDASSGIFERSGLRQPDHAVLARAIRSCPRQTYQARGGRHVYDSSTTALLEHLPNFVLEAEPNAFEIDVDRTIPVFFGLLVDGCPSALDPGIIEGDIQAAKPLDRFLYEHFNFRGFRHVGLHERALAASGMDQLDGFFSFLFAAARDHRFGSRFREKYGGLTADTRRAACHKPNFALQFRCHNFPQEIPPRKIKRHSVGLRAARVKRVPEVTGSTGSLTNAFQCAGRELDSETGLYFYRARYFDLATGRFLTEDPLNINGDDLNFYR